MTIPDTEFHNIEIEQFESIIRRKEGDIMKRTNECISMTQSRQSYFSNSCSQ